MAERTIGGLSTVSIGRDNLERVARDAPATAAVLFQPNSRLVSARIAAALVDAGIEVLERQLPDGEAAKSFSTVEETIEWLADRGVTRSDLIVGVGGGALTDVAGFVASVYLRGVAVRYVPTTLLGAVDAAIGGKTAVNVAAKNLAGTFSHPELVVIDVEVLAGLDDELLRHGMAEVVKAGLIGDLVLLELVESGRWRDELDDVVERAVAVKADIVEFDFRESGRRAHLNFGHTIGHAVEVQAAWPHGPAVAVGMVAAAAISAAVAGFGGFDRVVSALESLGLPVASPKIGSSDAIEMVRRDKKSDAAGLRMVLLEDIGAPLVTHVDTATLRLGLESIGIR